MYGRKIRVGLIVAVVWLLAGLCGVSRGEDGADSMSQEEKLAAIGKLENSWVRVEITLKYDKGQPPDIGGWGERCPNCGEIHQVAYGQELMREERPLEAAGLLMSPTEVITNDFMIHPRFVEKVQVRFGDKVVSAKPKAYARRRTAMLLELAEPLTGTKPVEFSEGKKGPFAALNYTNTNGQWTTTAADMSPGVISERETGKRFRATKTDGLIVTGDGTAVGMCMGEELPIGDSWQGTPLKWDFVSAESEAALVEKTMKIADACLLRTVLNFRSPKANTRDRYRYMDEDEGSATEKNTVAVLIDERKVLVLAKLNAKTTARLERITVFDADDKAHKATFAGTLADYGALAAELDEPLESPAHLSHENIVDCRMLMLASAEILVQGKNRVAYFQHRRIPQFDVGWRRQIYPQFPGDTKNLFLFDDQGRLVAIPVARREKIEDEDRWYSRAKLLTSSAYLDSVLGDLANNIDASNVPLSEQEENRLAWLGVELQGLNRELARLNNVSDQTNDGRTGAMVSYVYADSPAAGADIQVGAILVRLHAEGMPKPVEVKIEEDGYSGGMEFPWDQLDQVPAQYLDQMPKPWPGAENSFTRALTNLGFGKKFTAEFYIDGKKATMDFVVEEGPKHYDSAKRFKSEALGLTVRDLTYEVRRYFQRTEADGGVIVSKIESGSKAAVAGIKPYEIVTRVNEQPVKSVDDFEKMIAGQDELRITLKRMTRGRVVKIKMASAAAGQGASLE